jgi:dihydroflavonol-4-reductase
MVTTKRPTKTAAKKTATPADQAASKQPKKAVAKTKAAASNPKTALAPLPSPVTLVTGGTGFLGKHLLQKLADAGVPRLRVLTTGAPPAWLAELGVESLQGSITNADDVQRAVEGVAEIYHLAGFVSRRPDDAHKMYATHVEGTRLLCDAAVAAGTRSIVLASSSGTIAVSKNADIIHDETGAPPLELITRWGYYASKFYQERTALERFTGDGRRLVIVNPSLLLGPGDDRLSSTKVVLDFLARRIISTPTGGLNFVDARDAAAAFHEAMRSGRHGERYLLGAANWTFDKFFARLERISKVAAPRLAFPSVVNIFGARGLNAFYKNRNWASPVEPEEIEQAEHFWYFTSEKAERELDFTPRDPAETMQDTVTYVRRNFIGNAAFAS